jgi:hypothetical protein
MEFLAVVGLFPLLYWGLSLGCGLLVERLVGTTVPALLLAPIGFATLVCVSQFTTWWELSAPLTPLILLVLALLGLWLTRSSIAARWKLRPHGWWWGFAAPLATYLLVAAPEIAAGRVTFPGYLLDTTGGIQIAGAERLLHHAHDFSNGLPAYGTTLGAYFGNGYPSGGHGVLASVGWLSGQSLIWLYSPFQALDLSLVALVLVFIARHVQLPRPAAAVVGAVAAAPALVYAYALMGSIKELTALPSLVLMGALLVCARELTARAGARVVLLFGLAGAAALGSIGIAASPWVALFGACSLLAAVPLWRLRTLVRKRRLALIRRFVVGGALLALSTVLLGLPTVGPLSTTLKLAEGVSSSDSTAVADPGNLLRPLKFLQVLGVWLGESHRVEPKYVNQTYIFIGIVLICIALGIAWLISRRAWSVIVFAVGSLVVWKFLNSHGTTWTDAKLLVILSPVVLFVALVGAFSLLQTRLLGGILVGGLLVFGVLASDGLLYHGTNLAPTARYTELGSIGERFAGVGPTLAPDFDEYDFYLLREMEVDIPGVAYAGPFSYAEGAAKQYGRSYDLDSLTLESVERFNAIVMRRSPAWSRPPSNFKLLYSGSYYSVWRRDAPAPLQHMGLGGGYEPAAVPSCRKLRTFAAAAQRAGAQLTYAPRQPNVVANFATASHTPLVNVASDLEGRIMLTFSGPGRVEGGVRVARAGRYELWLGGDVDRQLKVSVDHHLVGAPSVQSGDDGTVIHVGDLYLDAGHHSFQLLRGGPSLGPDQDGSTAIDGVVLEPLGASAESEQVRSIAPSAWHSLCGQTLDWVESTSGAA